MKLRISILAALLAFSLTASAQTLQEQLTAYTEARNASELGTTPFYESDPAHAVLAAEVVSALQNGEKFTTNPMLLLSPYGNSLYKAGDGAAAAAVFRAAGSYGSTHFLKESATKAEILEHLLGLNTKVWWIVRESAAPRLRDRDLADTVAKSLIGQGIYGGPPSRGTRYDNGWVEWFDAKTAAMAEAGNAEVLDLLSAEIVALTGKPASDARDARLFQLRTERSIYSELVD